LRAFLDKTVKLRSRSLVEAGFLLETQDANRLEYAQRAQRVRVRRVLRLLERNRNVRLCRQVVDFVGLHLLNDPNEARGVGQVSMVQTQPDVFLVRILVQMIDAIGVEQRGPAFDAVNRIALLEKKLCEISAILTGYACDQSDFGRHCVFTLLLVL
jgi:hypothetical protein